MRDPREGLDGDGLITTGVRRDHVPRVFETVIDAAVAAVAGVPTNFGGGGPVELHLYGSVATGMALPGSSDVDLLTIGVSSGTAAALGRDLSRRFATLCRGVEIGAGQPEDYPGDNDEAYGNRVFLRHYCVCLLGSDAFRSALPFRGDARAARGFNGDIGRCLLRWRERAAVEASPELGRRIARKTLLAVAGLVSVHDSTWTTDRESSAQRMIELQPTWAGGLAELVAWSDGSRVAAPNSIHRVVAPGGIVESVVAEFSTTIGLWS